MQSTARDRLTAKALVYPAGTVSGYGHIYSLGIAGVPVVALDCQNTANFSSRYVQESHVVADPSKNHEAFVEWLIEYGKQQQEKPVLFMAEDLYAYIASLYEDELKGLYEYPYLAPEQLPLFFNKRHMHAAAERAGLKVPPTSYAPVDALDIQEWPVVVKPLVSRFTFDGRRLKDATRFPSVFGGKALSASGPSEWTAIRPHLEAEQIDYCVQNLIPGPNDSIVNIKFVASHEHEIPSFFVSRKRRQQPADFGTCAVAEAIDLPELAEQARAFCEETKLIGPGCIEFKRSSKDGEWYFIEINPRLDFWVRMATLHGVNLPLQQYLLSRNEPLFNKAQKSGGPSWIDVEGDIKGLLWRKRRAEWRIPLSQIISPYKHFHEAVMNFRDPLPGIRRFTRSGLRTLRLRR